MGGKAPTNNMNLDDWLHSAPPADIYVLGYDGLRYYLFIIFVKFAASLTEVNRVCFQIDFRKLFL